MDVFFDEEVEKEISKKINDLIFINEVNHIVCRSSTFDQNKTDYAEIEGNVERDGAYKIKVDEHDHANRTVGCFLYYAFFSTTGN